jgi:exopolysaccharide biosynthesis protein
MYRNNLLSCILLFSVTQLFAQTPIEWEKEDLVEGLEWWRADTELFDAPQFISVLKVDLKKRKLTLVYEEEENQLTSEMARAVDAIAAVNAGFFDILKGGSVTYIKVDGQSPQIDSTHWKVTDILNGALLIKRNGRLEVEMVSDYNRYERRKYDDVLITGSLLLDEGQPQPLADSQSFVHKRHPRTCLGIIDRNTVLLVTVDGRHQEAAGFTLPELRALMQQLGCYEAINLDGGGSTTMWIGVDEQGVVNHPSDNKFFDHEGEREVANILVIH